MRISICASMAATVSRATLTTMMMDVPPKENLVLLMIVPRFSFGGTSIIIVVSVALETVAAIEAQMLMRNYSGFLEK